MSSSATFPLVIEIIMNGTERIPRFPCGDDNCRTDDVTEELMMLSDDES